MRKIAGKSTSVSAPALETDAVILTYQKDVANELANSMAEISGTSYTARFSILQAEQGQRPVSFFSWNVAGFP